MAAANPNTVVAAVSLHSKSFHENMVRKLQKADNPSVIMAIHVLKDCVCWKVYVRLSYKSVFFLGH